MTFPVPLYVPTWIAYRRGARTYVPFSPSPLGTPSGRAMQSPRAFDETVWSSSKYSSPMHRSGSRTVDPQLSTKIRTLPAS